MNHIHNSKSCAPSSLGPVLIHRQNHLDAFGRLYLTTELWTFLLPVAAVFVGFFELMMRDRAGITRQESDQIGLKR